MNIFLVVLFLIYPSLTYPAIGVQEQEEQTPVATIAGQLIWEPSGFYEDGSMMSTDEISHYQIIFGTSKDDLSESVEFSVADLLTYDFAAATGHNTWFVGVKTVSIYGSVSNASNIAQFNVVQEDVQEEAI